MGQQVLWNLDRNSHGTVTCVATLPGGNTLKRQWTDVVQFVADGNEWVAEVAQAAPEADATPQDWPAARPTWPWPEDVSAQGEWLQFFRKWNSHSYEVPIHVDDLFDFASSLTLLSRFRNDSGYKGYARHRLDLILRSFAEPWHGYRVTREDGLFLLHSSTPVKHVRGNNSAHWKRAEEIATKATEAGYGALGKIAASMGLSYSRTWTMLRTATVFPPKKRHEEISFTHHSIAAITSDPDYWINVAATEKMDAKSFLLLIQASRQQSGGESVKTSSSERWHLADQALELKESLGYSTAQIARQFNLTERYTLRLITTAKTFPPDKRSENISFTRYVKAVQYHNSQLLGSEGSLHIERINLSRPESSGPKHYISVGFTHEELAGIDMTARRLHVSRSEYIRTRLFAERALVDPPTVDSQTHRAPNPRDLESLTGDTPLSRFWDTLAPWASHISDVGWFKQWPMAPDVLERIEAVWPMLTTHKEV